MHTKLCNICYSTIHAAAEICPNCDARQMPLIIQQTRQAVDGTLWLPVPALIIAIFTLTLLLLDNQGVDWNNLHNQDTIDEIIGLATFFWHCTGTGTCFFSIAKTWARYGDYSCCNHGNRHAIRN